MTVDISRVRFDPRNNYAWTIEQQGRVRLDADSLEGEAIQDRRWRSETFDILDRVALPAALPDSFRIDVVAGEIVIQPGRLYVDGLQAENHGNAPFAWNPILAERQGMGVVPFDEQPWRPGFAPGPLGPGRHIFYLDVWQRTVTYLEDPTLIEPAVAVDTTGRGQTVWQVRELDDVGDAGCATPDGEVPGWLDIVTPSAGRLSSRAHVGPPQNDPCLLPPGSGYTGLENRLYRVEIHDRDPAGAFRFKWAIHNATVATAILSLPAGDVLRVARVARDDVMRFNPGDWVEVTDDRRELEGTPGIFRQVQSVDDGAQTVTLGAALPAGTLAFDGAGPELDQAFHPRLRKWDQSGVVRDSDGNMLVDLGAPGSAGLIPVPPPGTFVQLGDGVEVSFSLDPAGGAFRPGDHWLFTARTAGRVVETLVEAPPLGIHHHYCRLAVVEVPAGGAPQVVEDCRPRPTESVGCCTVVVQPGDSIQAAIDSLPDEGGCVCLKSGLHAIAAPILIDRGNVSLHGESLGAVVQGSGGSSLLNVFAPGQPGIRVHGITWREGEASGGTAMIAIRGTSGMVFEDNRLQSFARGGSVGVIALQAQDLCIVGCEIEGVAIGVHLDRGCADVEVSSNRIATTGISANQPTTIGIFARGLIGPLVAERNDIEQAVNGIILNDTLEGPPQSLAIGSRLAANRIALIAAPAGGQASFGIDAAPAAVIVSGNRIEHQGGRITAIRVAGDGSIVDANVIRSAADAVGQSVAVTVGFGEDNEYLPVERVIVTENIVEGAQHGITVLGAAHVSVTGNRLAQSGRTSGLGVGLTNADAALVSDNQVSGALIGVFAIEGERNRISGNRFEGGGGIGVGLYRETGPTVSMNRMTGLSAQGIAAVQLLGRFEVIENRIENCGSGSETGTGISAYLVFGEMVIERNEIMNIGLPLQAGGPVAPVARGISCDLILEASVQGNLVTYSDMNARPPTAEDRALLMRGYLEYPLDLADGQIVLGFPIQIADNKFIGTGATALVELLSQPINDNINIRFERVIFTGNYCFHASLPFNDAFQAATVSLVGRRCSVANNHVKAMTRSFRSYHFHNMPGPFIGNVSHSGNWGRPPANQFPMPENNFNMIA
ncbi:DUF6519 domain-containing protein [Sphingosinicella sp. CPCC 101087]|uniref:DUF6519 domain-containing protein n=1 Tax=Sphingosinicella sp. CPCC 101087 TaxID=2497754 RepID=UPI00101C4C33|nr:DUF6519 domain-containing protein [Sphingosinicella sp. CPCC 101087]